MVVLWSLPFQPTVTPQGEYMGAKRLLLTERKNGTNCELGLPESVLRKRLVYFTLSTLRPLDIKSLIP